MKYPLTNHLTTNQLHRKENIRILNPNNQHIHCILPHNSRTERNKDSAIMCSEFCSNCVYKIYCIFEVYELSYMKQTEVLYLKIIYNTEQTAFHHLI